MIEINGYFIIVSNYENFDMATYSNYETEDEMKAAFDGYEINKQAEEIAEIKVKEDNNIPFPIWKAFAVSELRKAYAASREAFKR